GEKTEATLVLLDDGSLNNPPFTIAASGADNIFTDCEPTADCGGVPVDPAQGRLCNNERLLLTSNDTLANDNTWTRGFAIVTGNPRLTNQPSRQYAAGSKSNLASDCLTKARQEYPAISDLNAGQPVDFKIEVVDRSGNLTVWPQPLQAPLVPTTYICEGETGNADDCSCCWLISSNPETDCKGRPGMVGPGYPNGFCIDLFGN